MHVFVLSVLHLFRCFLSSVCLGRLVKADKRDLKFSHQAIILNAHNPKMKLAMYRIDFVF